MADRRFTTTCFRAMRKAPRASVTDITIGSSSGVSPTASATANRNDSSTGRASRILSSNTNNTSSMVRRMISMPNWRVPRSKAVGGAFAVNDPAMAPSAVAVPVRITITVADPLSTEEPMKTALVT